jgi:uncharacterized protein
MSRERLKLDVHAGQQANLERAGAGAPIAAPLTGAPIEPEFKSPTAAFEFATPRAKLIQEADRAIRRDLERYPKALQAYELLIHDEEALANWDMANFITVRKLGYNDHGRVHAWVTGAASLAILDLLLEAGVRGDVLESGAGDIDDTYLVAILGTMLHDIGNQVHRVAHEAHGVALAMPILERVLGAIYQDTAQRTKIRAFILHSINCHDLGPIPLTLEGGVTAVADGTDITKGRGRKAFALGKIDIHSVSALSIEQVTISKGTSKPIEIRVRMINSAGIFQVEDTLARKVINTPLSKYVDIIASAAEDTDSDQRVIESVHLEGKGFVKGSD